MENIHSHNKISIVYKDNYVDKSLICDGSDLGDINYIIDGFQREIEEILSKYRIILSQNNESDDDFIHKVEDYCTFLNDIKEYRELLCFITIRKDYVKRKDNIINGIKQEYKSKIRQKRDGKAPWWLILISLPVGFLTYLVISWAFSYYEKPMFTVAFWLILLFGIFLGLIAIFSVAAPVIDLFLTIKNSKLAKTEMNNSINDVERWVEQHTQEVITETPRLETLKNKYSDYIRTNS